MMFMLESEALLSQNAIFAIVSVALLAVLYIILRAVKAKRKPAEPPAEENEEEVIAAITAAVSLILEEEAEREERNPLPFRVVTFRRTNNRRIGE